MPILPEPWQYTTRNVYIPSTVSYKLDVLRKMLGKLKIELGTDGYINYDLVICQANGRPIMTEHLNKRFKDIFVAMATRTSIRRISYFTASGIQARE